MNKSKKAAILILGTVALVIFVSSYAYSSTVPIDTNKKTVGESTENELKSKFGAAIVNGYLNQYYDKQIAQGGDYAVIYSKLKKNNRTTWDGRDWAFFVTAINTVKYDYLPN